MKIRDRYSVGVILIGDDDKTYQVALTKEMSSSLIHDLQTLYFPNGNIKILPTPLEGVTIERCNYEHHKKTT